MQYNNDAKQMKFEVLKRVSELAFAGELQEKMGGIPYDIIPGSVPQYRCCVYKEREIIRERVAMACGRSLRGQENAGVVGVLSAACEGCPINRFSVTDNCQRCLAKKCVAACPFGAVSVSGKGAYIDPNKCRECGRCAAACPYNAISDTLRPCLRACPVDAISMDQNKQVSIQQERCIGCGACTTDCPFGAITDRSSIVKVIELLKQEAPVFAAFAPAIEGQFGEADAGQVKAALKKLGFTGAYEVALGADAVASHEAEELEQVLECGGKLTTSCCPAFVSMIERHYPKVLPFISKTVSPMTAAARYIKRQHSGSAVVFIGPCVAKKQEAERAPDSADYVLTFEELAAMFSAREISPAEMEEDAQDASRYGRNFAVSGGVSAAVSRAMDERGAEASFECRTCNGAAECKKALALLSAGKLPEDLLEGMACEHGCIGGPASVLPVQKLLRNRSKMLERADTRGIEENLTQHDFSDISMT